MRDARTFAREVLRVESWRLGAIPEQIRQPLNARCPATRARPMLRNFTAGGWAVRMHSLLRGAHALFFWLVADGVTHEHFAFFSQTSFQFQMKMDIHAIFNFSSVAYVALRYRCLIFVLFSTRFATDRSFASIYMVNDPRYTVADPRYTISVLHILPSHTFEYRAREQWKK